MGLKRKGAPSAVSPIVRLSRQRGALWGLAVGDALGVSFQEKRLATAPFPTVLPGPLTELRGGGPYQLRVGQVSLPTQLACVIATGLRTHARYDADATLKGYLRWREDTSADFGDLGEQLDPILQEYDEAGPHRGIFPIRQWLSHRLKSDGNGSLIRTSPIGVFFSKDAAARVSASLEDSAITHYDPRCQLACVCFNASLAAAIESPQQATPAEMLAASLTELNSAAAQLARNRPEHSVFVQEAAEQLKEDLKLAQKPDPELYGPDLHLHATPDRVRLTFRLAYWELFHAPSTERAMLDPANRGGDSSANAAVAGALLGAVHGEESIPERWRTTVWDALTSVFPRGPLWERYHPRQLLTLLDS